MIQEFVDRFMADKPRLRAVFTTEHPEYGDIVAEVVESIRDKEKTWGSPDPKRITKIDHGDYQGTLVYVIGEGGYQPDQYWTVKMDYGSCSVCDTLQAIRGNSFGSPTKEQVDDYMTLALHIVQQIKEIE